MSHVRNFSKASSGHPVDAVYVADRIRTSADACAGRDVMIEETDVITAELIVTIHQDQQEFFGGAEWLSDNCQPEQLNDRTFRRLAGAVSLWLECYPGWGTSQEFGGSIVIWTAPEFAGRFKVKVPAVILDRRDPGEVRVLLEDGSDVSCRNPADLLKTLDRLHCRRGIGEPDFRLLGARWASYLVHGTIENAALA